MKLMTIIGARPQFIKAAPFSEEFRKNNKEILVHTGQHYDENMSEVFFSELGIPSPDYNLGVGSGTHGKQTATMLEGIEKIIFAENPDGLLVYGDTNSTLAGALAASKLHVPVFHVEAGLRSYNKLMPEEQNRILTDHISNILLCPTQTAVENLKKEGITKGVINSGDIMFDAVIRNIHLSKKKYSAGSWINGLTPVKGKISSLIEKNYYLATIHRAENTDSKDKLVDIFRAFNTLDKPVLLPIHPRTLKLLGKFDVCFKNVIIIKPVGYLMMLYLISNSYMVITDSGGLQKEAFFLKVPCTTLRDQTEWIETLENSWNVLSQIDVEVIISKVQRDLTCLRYQQPRSFGEGNAAKKICEAIINGGKINE